MECKAARPLTPTGELDVGFLNGRIISEINGHYNRLHFHRLRSKTKIL